MHRPSWVLTRAVLAVLVTVGVAGCGSSQDQRVAATAGAFAEAVTGRDAAEACALLAPRTKAELEQATGTACEDSLLGEVLALRALLPGSAVGDVLVFGAAGRASIGRDVVFLARFRGGWKIAAAECTATGGGVYDCGVKGS